MFGRYSWGDFLELLLLVTLAYYSLIVYLFYRKDFHRFLFPFGKANSSTTSAANKPPNPMALVHEMVSEVAIVIKLAADNNTPLPELLYALRLKISDYLILEPTELKAKINLYIAQELEESGYYGIEQVQIENLWKD